MTKYSAAQQRRSVTNNEREPHPVWRRHWLFADIVCTGLVLYSCSRYGSTHCRSKLADAVSIMGYPVYTGFALERYWDVSCLLSFFQSQDNLYAILRLPLSISFLQRALFVWITHFFIGFIGPSALWSYGCSTTARSSQTLYSINREP